VNSFKKIALGLAAAMSFGVLSALPTSAAVIQPTLTIDSATDSIVAGETATAVVTLSFISETAADTATVLSAIFSQPSGSSKSATLTLLETATSVVTIAAGSLSADVNSTVGTPGFVTAKFTVSLVAPSVAGTYEARILTTRPAAGPSVAWTVTVKAADITPSAATTTSILNAGETTAAVADATVYAPKATSTDAAAVIVVTPKNAAGGSATESILATVSGSGMIGHGSNATSISAQGRSLVIPSGNHIGVFADGTAGVSTITLTTLTGTVLATEKVTFYGDIASIVATTVKSVIPVGSNVSTIKAVAYDAAGVTVGAGTLNAFSSNVSVVSDSGTAATIVNGEALFTLTGVKTGGVAVTIKSGTVSSAPVATRVEGTAATVKLSFDKAAYLPGEAATITVQVLDATGLPVSGKTHANLFATGGIVSNYAFGSASDVLTSTSVTTDTATVKTYKVFMPLVQNTIKITATGGSSLPVAGQVVVSAEALVEDSAQKAATDAAKEALEASNAATTAALDAAKAADAATAAAQAATDAVAALSESVAKLIAGLQAQIKSLATVVAKIAKKVKA
jgi:trimeric autotransporter adhesin